MESDYETDYEDETDFSSNSLISPQTVTINNIIKDNYNPLTEKEYFKLVFSNEYIAKDVLLKRASQFWWLNKSETIVNGGKNSSHFALKR